MENQSQTKFRVLKMVFDLVNAGHAEELQDVVLDHFSGQLKEESKGRIHELKSQLNHIADVLDIAQAFHEDGTPLTHSEIAELQIDTIVNLIP